MASVTLSLEDLGGSDGDGDADPKPTYWSPEFHDTDSGLRFENWAPAIREHMLPGADGSRVVVLQEAAGAALLRWREEVKMYANLVCTHTPNSELDAAALMVDASFLTLQDARIEHEWAASEQRGAWLRSLHQLRDELDDVVKGFGPTGVFLKLSARSPKDAVICHRNFRRGIVDAVLAYGKGSGEGTGSAPPKGRGRLTLSDQVQVIKGVAWQSMRVRSGAEALDLLLRSDRVYLDILQHDLFRKTKPGAASAFDLNIHVSAWFDGFSPSYEFRGFVSAGRRTVLTQYNPWVYEPDMVRNKATILATINKLWDAVEQKVMHAHAVAWCFPSRVGLWRLVHAVLMHGP